MALSSLSEAHNSHTTYCLLGRGQLPYVLCKQGIHALLQSSMGRARTAPIDPAHHTKARAMGVYLEHLEFTITYVTLLYFVCVAVGGGALERCRVCVC